MYNCSYVDVYSQQGVDMYSQQGVDVYHSCQPVQPEFLDKESTFPWFYNISLDIAISHNKMINSQKK